MDWNSAIQRAHGVLRNFKAAHGMEPEPRDLSNVLISDEESQEDTQVTDLPTGEPIMVHTQVADLPTGVETLEDTQVADLVTGVETLEDTQATDGSERTQSEETNQNQPQPDNQVLRRRRLE